MENLSIQISEEKLAELGVLNYRVLELESCVILLCEKCGEWMQEFFIKATTDKGIVIDSKYLMKPCVIKF